MQKGVLVIWATIAHITITPGRVPPPISACECSPLEVLPNGIFQKLSRVFVIRLFFCLLLPLLLPILPCRKGTAPAFTRGAVPEVFARYAAFTLRFITSSAIRPVSSAMLSNFAR